jgi:hypothetical protein
MLLHPLRSARRAIALVLGVAVGVLDAQAFQAVPPLHTLAVTGLGHALLLLATGLFVGFLYESWLAVVFAPLAFLLGFAAATAVQSRTLAGLTSVHQLQTLLQAESGPVVLLILGAGLVIAMMRGWLHVRRRQPHEPPRPPEGAGRRPEVLTPVPPRGGQTPEPRH